MRGAVAHCLLPLLACMLVASCTNAPAPRPSVSDADRQLVLRLKADVTLLAQEIGVRHIGHGDSLARSANWIESELRAAGWSVTRQPYTVDGGTCCNLIAERRGTTLPEEIVVVGAHYDTVQSTPGADDNASGVAALLALARELKTAAPARTLRFVAFANEEPPFFHTEQMGSLVYARACREKGEKIVAMLALESLGFFSDAPKSQHYPLPLSLFYPSRGNFLAVVGNRESRELVGRVTKHLRSATVLPVEAAALPGSITGVGFSDQWSFWQVNYPGVMITDTALFRNPHYHRPTDTPDTLDYERLALAVRGLHAVVADLAGLR